MNVGLMLKGRCSLRRPFRALSVRTLISQGFRARFACASTLGSTVTSLQDFGPRDYGRYNPKSAGANENH